MSGMVMVVEASGVCCRTVGIGRYASGWRRVDDG
jgi:hypothetical protein